MLYNDCAHRLLFISDIIRGGITSQFIPVYFRGPVVLELGQSPRWIGKANWKAMADYLEDISGEGSEKQTGETVAGDVGGNERESATPNVQIQVDQSPGEREPQAGADTRTESGVGGDGNAPEEPPASPAVHENPAVTPKLSVEFPPGADGARFRVPRVSFQQEPDVVKISSSQQEYPLVMENNKTDGLDVPLDRYTPYVSTSPTPDLYPPDPIRPPLHQQRSRLGSKRDSEWVFRPLKLKFKVKELEELYRNYVYRQQQSLVFTACLIMVALSVMLVISFLANTKVCNFSHSVHMHMCMYIH